MVPIMMIVAFASNPLHIPAKSMQQMARELNAQIDDTNERFSNRAKRYIEEANNTEKAMNALIAKGCPEDAFLIAILRKGIKSQREQAEWFASNPLKTIELKKK